MSARSLWEWLSSPTSARSPAIVRPSPSKQRVSGESSPGGAGVVKRLDWASSSAQTMPKLLDGRGEETVSHVLSAFVLSQLAVAIPARFAYSDWCLLYSTAVHGISLNTFYARTAGCGCCVLCIKDGSGNVFGAFCTEWREPSNPPKFYGCGETFLYSVERVEGLPPLPLGDQPPPHEALHVHRWSGENAFFMFSHRDHLAMGSGGHFGLWLDAELLHGTSGPSDTFRNECLCRQSAPCARSDEAPAVGEFRCEVLEVWGMEHAAISRRRHKQYLDGVRPR